MIMMIIWSYVGKCAIIAETAFSSFGEKIANFAATRPAVVIVVVVVIVMIIAVITVVVPIVPVARLMTAAGLKPALGSFGIGGVVVNRRG